MKKLLKIAVLFLVPFGIRCEGQEKIENEQPVNVAPLKKDYIFDLNEDGEKDFFSTVLKNANSSRLVMSTYSVGEGSVYIVFFNDNGEIKFLIGDTDKDKIFDKLIVFGKKEKPQAFYAIAENGLFKQLPINEADEIFSAKPWKR